MEPSAFGVHAGWIRCGAFVICTLLWSVMPTSALPITAAYYDSSSGLEWAQVSDTASLSWDQLSTVCATDGLAACSANIGTVELAGWTWATSAQVLSLFDAASDLTAAQLADQTETAAHSTWAPQLLSYFDATFFERGASAVYGMSSDGPSFDPQGAWVPYVFDDNGMSEDTASKRNVIAKYTSTSTVGAWLYKSVEVSTVPEPASLSLTLLGAAGLIASRRRQRSHRR